MLGIAGVGFVLLAGSGLSAAADSVYTRHDWSKCAKLPAPETHLVTRCTGHAGIPVWYGLGEHGARLSLSGPDRLDGPVQGPWPSIGTTVEWRGTPLGGGRVVPVAAIVGVTLNENPVDPKARKWRVLAVYKVARGKSGCLMAIVSPDEGADLNRRARELADRQAADFACPQP
jgi:hypothetical protein